MEQIKRTEIVMDTLVTIRIHHREPCTEIEAALDRAFSVFRYVESVCSRFTPDSEVMQLAKRVGVPVTVSPVLFEAVQFALEIAKVTNGDFDPTVGARLEQSGFNRHYLTQKKQDTNLSLIDQVSYRSIELNPQKRTILLHHPLILDLGAVVKGGSHLINPKTGASVHDLISSTVVAPFAMLADAFSTAVFISGFDQGLHLLNQEGLDGILVSSDFKLNSTKGMKNYAFKPISID